MTDQDMVELLARALNPAAFKAVAQPNAPEWPTLIYEEFCAAARKQVRTVLAEIERQGFAIIRKE